MEAEKKDEGAEQAAAPVGWTGQIGERYKKMKEHAEAYPYVWASYALVYGGFGLWFTYRFRKLRKTEDRVRALQKRLREIHEAEQAAESGASTKKPVEKPKK